MPVSAVTARVAALALPLLSTGLFAAPLYHLTDLGPNTEAIAGINSSGKVVLTHVRLGTRPTTVLTWRDGHRQVMDGGGTSADANAIADGGAVAGIHDLGDGMDSVACVWASDGTRTDLGTLGGTYSSANGVNGDGLVVGGSAVSAGSQQYEAFLWRDGVFTVLATLGGTQSSAAAIGPGSDPLIVGMSSLPSQTAHAVLWRHGVIHDLGTLARGFSSEATALNASGVVVGWSTTSTRGIEHAFRWDSDHGMQDLGTLGTYSQASAINGAGDIVGQSAPHGAPTAHGFLVTGGQMLDLNALLDDSGAGWVLITATGINDAGQITGLGLFDGGRNTHGVVLTPVAATRK